MPYKNKEDRKKNYQKNRETILKGKKESYHKNKEKYRAKRRRYYFKNKEKVVKEYKGLIDKKNIIELGKGTLMVSKEKQKDLVHIFENFGVKYEFKRLVYA